MAKKRKGDAPKDLGEAIEAGYQPMFMTPHEVTKHFRLGDADPAMWDEHPQKATEETLAYKLHDAEHAQSYDGKTSLYESIKREGIKTPLSIGRSPFESKPILVDGHHRLAVSRHLNPNQFLPLEYH